MSEVSRFSMPSSKGVVKASEAIILYRKTTPGKREHEVEYALVHEIQDDNGRQRLGVGKTMTMESLQAVVTELIASNVEKVGVDSSIGFLPPNVLMKTSDKICWWIPPMKHSVFLKVDGENVMEVEFPGLIFKAMKNQLCLASFKGNEPPTEATQVFCAPVYNISESGVMCMGNVDKPNPDAGKLIQQWELAFFGSNFTHPGANNIVLYDGGITGLWNDLAKGKVSSITDEYLKPLMWNDKKVNALTFCAGAKDEN